MNKIPVGLLGASGLVGQTYIKILKDNPRFELVFTPKREELHLIERAQGCELIFSALSNEGAPIEYKYAELFPVISSASCHRLVDDVPVIIPEINPHHFQLIELQQKKRGWKGCLIAKPNCTLQSILPPLFPLHTEFKLKGIAVTSLQAISGAGSYFSLENNVIPFIEGEEEKCILETEKILEVSIPMSVHCNRVPVSHGHLACISASFEKKPTLEEVKELWSCSPHLLYLEEKDRPQPHYDVESGAGMAVSIGRLRTCGLMDIRFTALSHNLIRGAAGSGVKIAETWVNYAASSSL